ncbi:MAG: ABC transporter ATP-binding protein [Phycisphaerales bacterium]|nr:ABC transporter ATP-binding protein [Phycisphaerales bacterium]
MAFAAYCRDLYKRYDARKKAVDAVNGITLEVHEGECFGLLGPNGAGKTTTVEIFEGLLTQTSGHVEVLGRQWSGRDADEIRQRIGISLQDTKLNDKLTVLETLTLFRSFYRTGREPESTIDMVSLDEKANAFVGKLSGGQKQRLAVACALVGDPELLFLDEPTTGLDPQSRRELWDIIREQRDRARTTLITTHYMDEAQRLCDRVAVVDHGKVIALGSPDELIRQIGGEHVIEFDLIHSDGQGSVVGADLFQGLPSVNAARAEGGGYSLTVSEPHRALPALITLLQSRQLELGRLATRHVSLEDVFVTLTGRHLRDEEISSN